MYNLSITLIVEGKNLLDVNILIFIVASMQRYTYFTEVLSAQDVFSALQLPGVPHSLCSLLCSLLCLSSQGQPGMTDTMPCLQYPYFNANLLFLG